MHTLADTHITRTFAADENQTDNVTYLPSKLSKKAKSPLIDMWHLEKLVTVDALQCNEFNALENCRFPDRIIYDITLIESKNAKERAKAQEVCLTSLNKTFDYFSKSKKCGVLITDASVLLLSTDKQAVVAWHVWHSDQFTSDFCAGGLATSDDTETLTITGALGNLVDFIDSISEIEEIHVFLDSINAIHHLIDPSIHSAQSSVIIILSILTPWMKENDNHRIIFHYVLNYEDYVFKPYRAVHKLATSTKIECGQSALRTIAFSRKQITDNVMSDWANQFQLSQYIGRHFMYPKWSVCQCNHTGAARKPPFHLNEGMWLKDVGHSSSLTAQMVCGLTSHTPIGHYRHHFNIGDKIEACPHCEGGSTETFHHILYRRLKHPTRPPDASHFSEMSPLWDDFGKFIMDNPIAFAFKDSSTYRKEHVGRQGIATWNYLHRPCTPRKWIIWTNLSPFGRINDCTW